MCLRHLNNRKIVPLKQDLGQYIFKHYELYHFCVKTERLLLRLLNSTAPVADATLFLLGWKITTEWWSLLIMNRWRQHFWRLVCGFEKI